MVNRNVFTSAKGKLAPKADTTNRAGGVAYKMPDKHALVQYAVTNTFNNTFYAKGKEHLNEVRDLCDKIDPTFLAKTAVYSREKGYMKDMPAFLTASLVGRGEIELVKKIFPRTIDNGKQLKNFAQIVRSGVVGRKSFGSATRNIMRQWLDKRNDSQLFNDAIGGDVTMKDLIKMVHPKPKDEKRSAFYAYLLGKKYSTEALPPLLQHYEDFKNGKTKEVPRVDFRYLSALDLDPGVWKAIAGNAGWTMTRMNINTFIRHDVFTGSHGKELIKLVADRLANREEIKKARAFPYQLLAAFQMTEGAPREITLALQDAAEIACENVETYNGDVVVCPDVSGSMGIAVTGDRGSASSKIRCIDVAALVASVYLRKNNLARVIPFEGHVVNIDLNPRDSIMTNAQKLAAIGGGSTDCSAPLRQLNAEKANVDLVILVSDGESWVFPTIRGYYESTPMMREWVELKARNKNAKLVLIDIQADIASQAPQQTTDILIVGGWSDQVFDIIRSFVAGETGSDSLVAAVDAIQLDT